MNHMIRNRWIRLHRRGPAGRFLPRLAFLVVVVLAVCYPRPGLLLRHLRHFRDPNAMIAPDAPELAPLLAELRPSVDRAENPQAILRLVQRYVHAKIPYAFDWETWGVVEYLPTVQEVLDAGREDCDGRALVAASLLRNLGFQAELVWDGAHMWVWTPQGETMSPNALAIVHVTADGREFNWAGLLIAPRVAAFGLAVFPLSRELTVALALWLVLLAPGVTPTRAICTGISLVLGLLLIRAGGRDWHAQMAGMYGVGFGALAGVVLVDTLGAARARARGVLNGSPARPPLPTLSGTLRPRRNSRRRRLA